LPSSLPLSPFSPGTDTEDKDVSIMESRCDEEMAVVTWNLCLAAGTIMGIVLKVGGVKTETETDWKATASSQTLTSVPMNRRALKDTMVDILVIRLTHSYAILCSTSKKMMTTIR
jgi:hypothetical protein